MCFSPVADLTGSIVIGAIGVDALVHVKRTDRWLFAALPLLFGLHQFAETFVWWGLGGHIPSQLGSAAKWVYLLFAFVVLPTYVPLAIRALEPPGRRRDIMTGFVALGVVVSASLLIAMLRGPVTASLSVHHVDYGIQLEAGLPIVIAYVAATCASALVSGFRHIVIFGAANLVAVVIIATLTISGFASVWCGWAAVTSMAIALHLRYGAPHRSVVQALS